MQVSLPRFCPLIFQNFSCQIVSKVMSVVPGCLRFSRVGAVNLSDYDLKQIDGWFNLLDDFETGFVEKEFLKLNSKQMMNLLETGEQLYQNSQDLIAQEVQTKRCPITSHEQRYRQQGPRNQNVVANFVPAFMATLRTAFLFFRPGKVPTIVWECSLLLGLYFQLFSLPYHLTLLVGGSIGLANAAIGVTAFIAIVAAILYVYIERNETHPSDLDPYEMHNLVEDYRKGKKSGCVARDEILEKILKFLHATVETRKHILIVGENGAGKTMLLEKITEQVAMRRLDWGVYNAKRILDETFDSYNSNRAGRYDVVSRRLGRCQPTTVFRVEEWISRVADDKTDALASFLRDLLTETQILFIFTIGRDQYDALEKRDKTFRKEKGIESSDDGHGQMTALLERFETFRLEDHASEKDNATRVKSEIDRLREYVMCEKGLEEVVIELTESPLKARGPVDLVKKAINTVKATFESPTHTSQDLVQLEFELGTLKDQHTSELEENGYTKKTQKLWNRFQRKQTKITQAKKRLAKITKKIHDVRELGKQVLACQQRIYDLALSLQAGNSQDINRLYYLVYIDLPKRVKVLAQKQREIPPKYPTVVDAALLTKLRSES